MTKKQAAEHTLPFPPRWAIGYPCRFMDLRVRVPARGTAFVSCQTQEIIRPHTLHYVGPRDTFDLVDLKIGRNSQDLFMNGGNPIALDHFRGPEPEGVRQALYDIVRGIENLTTPFYEADWKDDARRFAAAPAIEAVLSGMGVLKRLTHNLGQIEVVQVAMSLTLVITNRTMEDRDFECLVYGDGIDL